MCVQFFSNQHLLVSSSNLLFEFCDLDCCMFFIYCGSVLLNNLSRHYSRHQAHLSQLRGRNTIYALFTLCSRNQNDLNIRVCIFSTQTNKCQNPKTNNGAKMGLIKKTELTRVSHMFYYLFLRSRPSLVSALLKVCFQQPV